MARHLVPQYGGKSAPHLRSCRPQTWPASIYGRQYGYLTGAVPYLYRDAVHILFGLDNGSVIVFALDDHGGALNVPFFSDRGDTPL